VLAKKQWGSEGTGFCEPNYPSFLMDSISQAGKPRQYFLRPQSLRWVLTRGWEFPK
jgi:hypothetical protein